ncbi:MAG: dihydroorotate dehydrogenase (quinone) [Bacteroidetes bacterium RIFCSPLOWO2_02_FULL_36_8]|nr:MAG: dihydroorotate dehydrogenase (quinone) [Bacteroidetes bacterium RIFCSPLOWO2_02_FULL_36_8]OFY69694.1 MAG: dihydroorotate dehydrogenase (quinone) [Bacteroidetes bacterium RIFCSPLOWO2_12_FULL_37_12]
MYKLLKFLLFLLSPETAHRLTMSFLQLLFRFRTGILLYRIFFPIPKKQQGKTLAGLHFQNVLGIAAGFDKNAVYLKELSIMGFGFIEIGTVTPLPQKGNFQPRLFRLPKDQALINRMGFNNDGVKTVALHIKEFCEKEPGLRSQIIIGGNISKNKNTPNADAFNDYGICFDELHNYVDYFVLNVSSPNTPGLRELQGKEGLLKIINFILEKNKAIPTPKPLFIKISPDVTTEGLNEIAEAVIETKLTGVIITNTTIERQSLKSTAQKISSIGEGGLSGKPLLPVSTEILGYMRAKLPPPFVLIGSGGIMTDDDAILKFNSGADLVQIFTGFIYEGPGLMGRILSRKVK